MNPHLLLSTLYRRISRYKFKSFIMMLGIIIAVFALTVGITSGTTTKRLITEYFNKTFLPNSISITPNYSATSNQPVTEDDYAAIQNGVNGIAAITPIVNIRNQTFSRLGINHSAMVIGMNADGQQVMGQAAEWGEYLVDADIHSKARVMVIGKTVAETLFPNQSPVGQQLALNNSVYDIKGVLQSLGSDPHGGDLDNIILVPYTTLLRNNKNNYLTSIRLIAQSQEMVNPIANDVTAILRDQHNINHGRENSFIVSTSPQGQSSYNRMKSMFLLLLPIIVGTIFLISAIVITIIMLINIRERRSEIGLRMAVGARPMDVKLQFFLEVATLSLLGGVLGCAAAWLSFPLFNSLLADITDGKWALRASPVIFSFSVLCAVLVGIVTGYYPARKASKVVPVEVLR